jgi:hypothetical protein
MLTGALIGALSLVENLKPMSVTTNLSRDMADWIDTITQVSPNIFGDDL